MHFVDKFLTTQIFIMCSELSFAFYLFRLSFFSLYCVVIVFFGLLVDFQACSLYS